MTNQWDPNSVFEVLSDEKARKILVATNDSPRSAQELEDICEGSQTAIYRRVQILREFDLLTQHTRIDVDGNHCYEYSTHSDEFEIELNQASITVDVNDIQYTEQWPEVIG